MPHSTGLSRHERASSARHAGDPITISIGEATRQSGLSKSKIYNLINEGRLQSIHVDRRQLVIFASLKSLLSGAEAA